jgi:hypothetical protein
MLSGSAAQPMVMFSPDDPDPDPDDDPPQAAATSDTAAASRTNVSLRETAILTVQTFLQTAGLAAYRSSLL